MLKRSLSAFHDIPGPRHAPGAALIALRSGGKVVTIIDRLNILKKANRSADVNGVRF
jgi:hypothetical protein